jgi:hypothetical protein
LKAKLKAILGGGKREDVVFSGIDLARSGEQSRPVKALAADFRGRFREIISDPLNVLIERHPLAGCIDDGMVVLHNGMRVPAFGKYAYYGDFSDILVINRGVHEPLEEYIFQHVLKRLPPSPVMLELGAYWGHYSMWCQSVRSQAKNILVEPDTTNLEAARRNFSHNNLNAEFIQDFVGHGKFSVSRFCEDGAIESLDILHSDIQGYEVEMLQDAMPMLAARKIGHVFVSTHSNELHKQCGALLKSVGYRIEVSSDFETETTSGDGFIYAANPDHRAIFAGFEILGRKRLAAAHSKELIAYLTDVGQRINRSQIK